MSAIKQSQGKEKRYVCHHAATCQHVRMVVSGRNGAIALKLRPDTLLQALDHHSPGSGNASRRGSASKMAKFRITVKYDWQRVAHGTTFCGPTTQIQYGRCRLSLQALAKPRVGHCPVFVASPYHVVCATTGDGNTLLAEFTHFLLRAWQSVWIFFFTSA